MLFFILIFFHYFRAFPEYAACEVIAIPAKYDFKPYAYGFQKDSPYLGIFNHYLKDMREKGSLNQILKKYEAAPQVCPDSSGLPLGFDSCFTAFLLLIGKSIKIYVPKINIPHSFNNMAYFCCVLLSCKKKSKKKNPEFS